MARTRSRKLFSIQNELVLKSRESALAAVQIFNNPLINFKSELYIVTMCIGWTYLLHAYYRGKGIDYRYCDTNGKKKRYHKTRGGAYKHWELERCLNDDKSPIEKDVANNLRFLIGVRHEIEHQMTTRIDSSLSAKFQACCLNFNFYIKQFFGEKYGIDKHLSFSLQFSTLDKPQIETLAKAIDLPANIGTFITSFEDGLSEQEFNSPQFAYRVFFVAKTANRKGQADEVIEFVKSDSEVAQQANLKYALIKETERPKFLPRQIISQMQKDGYPKFNYHFHSTLWKSMNAKAPDKGLGTQVASHWYWYEPCLQSLKSIARRTLIFINEEATSSLAVAIAHSTI